MQYKRNDGRVTSEILADDGNRFLIKATWKDQDVPNILWVPHSYFNQKYSNALQTA